MGFSSSNDAYPWTPPRSGSPTLDVPIPLTERKNPIDDPLIGSFLGSFKLLRRIGQGGMGVVYLGHHEAIGRKAAIKLLHPHLCSEPTLVKRFYDEARAANLINHEHIVSVFDMAVAGNQHYIIMEYLEGQSLAELATAALPAEVAFPILAQISAALDAAHSHGVVHRDLKPDNVFLVQRGSEARFAKLLDFGIAKLFAEPERAHTAVGTVIGTPDYMSPEQAGGLVVDGRTDVYALGVISYLLATGQLPFNGRTVTEILIAHLNQRPVPPADLVPGIPKAWSEATLKALAKRPEDRFPTAGAFCRALLGEDQPPAPLRMVRRPMVDFKPLDQPAQRAEFSELSKAGMFICSDAPPPPLLSRVTVRFDRNGRFEEQEAEVVRHVSAAEALEWRMSPGFAVQFLRPLGHTPAPVPVDQGRLLRLLAQYKSADPYRLLGLTLDAEFSEVNRRLRQVRAELESLREPNLLPSLREQLQATLQHVESVVGVLRNPVARIRFDSQRGNFLGVARCVRAGLTATEIEEARTEHLAKYPAHQAQAQIHIRAAATWQATLEPKKALDAYASALALDPANVELQHRYWKLHSVLAMGSAITQSGSDPSRPDRPSARRRKC